MILQAREQDRATPSDLANIYVRSATTSSLVPLSNLVHVEETAGPTELKRFDRLRSITISAEPQSRLLARRGARLHGGPDAQPSCRRTRRSTTTASRASSSAPATALYATFLLALVIVFLVLAAQFESFRHPFIIMMTVPLAVTGALLGLWVTDRLDQRLQPDRLHHADRPRGQERHPDRRVRQPAARPRRRVPRGRDRGVGDPPAPGADDEPVHGVRRGPAADRLGRRRGEPQARSARWSSTA